MMAMHPKKSRLMSNKWVIQMWTSLLYDNNVLTNATLFGGLDCLLICI